MIYISVLLDSNITIQRMKGKYISFDLYNINLFNHSVSPHYLPKHFY